MAAQATNPPDKPTADVAAADPLPAMPPVHDPRANRRQATALAASLLLHGAVLALILFKFPLDVPRIQPQSIPVELVFQAAPKLEAESSVSPPPHSSDGAVRESGGDTNRDQGGTDAALPPGPEPAPAVPPAPPTPAPPVPALDLALKADPTAPPLAVAVPVPPPEIKEAVVPIPPPRRPPARSQRDATQSGEGGGDRYLNTVRDNILRHRVTPAGASAIHFSGMTRYRIIVSRQGELLRVSVLQSSGSTMVDEAGMDTIRHAAPFGPVPPDVAGNPVALVIVLHTAP